MSRFSRYAVALATAAVAIAGFTPAALADIGDFIGSWNNADPSTAGITHVVVQPVGGGNAVRVHVFGRCHPSDCDWGTVMGHAYTDSVSSPEARSVVATFNSGFSTDQVILRRGPGHTLRMDLYVAFTDASGRNDYMTTGQLDPAPGWGGGPWPPLPPIPGGPGWSGGSGGSGGGGIGAEDCIGFNPATADVVFVNGSWKYVDGSHWILDFGSNHAAANQARHVINHYHLDEQCFVVRPNASMTYWRTNGGIPAGGMGGSDCIPVNTGAVQVQFAGGAWKVIDASNGDWLLDFGGNHAGADRAAATIHYYGMNRQCFVGRTPGPPGMQYWLSH
jgi:hypothetical protein